MILSSRSSTSSVGLFVSMSSFRKSERPRINRRCSKESSFITLISAFIQVTSHSSFSSGYICEKRLSNVRIRIYLSFPGTCIARPLCLDFAAAEAAFSAWIFRNSLRTEGFLEASSASLSSEISSDRGDLLLSALVGFAR